MKSVENKLPKIKTRKELEKHYEKWVANDQTLKNYDSAQQYASLFVKDPTDEDVDDYRDEWFEIRTNIGYYIFSIYNEFKENKKYNEIINSFGGEDAINWDDLNHPVYNWRDENNDLQQEDLIDAISRELLKTPLALKKWSDEKIKNRQL